MGKKSSWSYEIKRKMIHVFYDAMQLNNFQAFSHFFNEILWKKNICILKKN